MKQVVKKNYTSILLKKQFFSLIKWINLPERRYKRFHFKGVFTVKLDVNHQFKMYHLGTSVENESFFGGIENRFERKSLKLWRKLCVDANIVLDIGVNTGLYSLVIKALNPTSEVYAFELIPKVKPLIKNKI